MLEEAWGLGKSGEEKREVLSGYSSDAIIATIRNGSITADEHEIIACPKVVVKHPCPSLCKEVIVIFGVVLGLAFPKRWHWWAGMGGGN